MIEFLVYLAILFGIIWIIGLIIAKIIKIPGKIIYHISGKAALDKNRDAETRAKRAELEATFTKSEKDREKNLKDSFAHEVKLVEESLRARDITDNTLVIIRKENGITVDIGIFKKLYHHSNYLHQKPKLEYLLPSSERGKLWPGYLSKSIAYIIEGPIVCFNVAENDSFVRYDQNLHYTITDHLIIKADPRFELIFDEKVNKPIRKKLEEELAEKLKKEAAELAAKLKIERAKNKLDDMFK